MDPRRTLAILMAALTITALATGAAMAATTADSDGDAIRVGEDSPINSDERVEQYEQNGAASADIPSPQMTVTVGEEREDVGLPFTLSALKGDTRNDFVRIHHREDLSRTVELPIRAAYWEPFPREDLESLSSDHVAALKPVEIDGAEYTVITVKFDGEGDAVFPIPKDAVAAYSAAKNTENRTNSTFGIDLGLTESPWSHVDSAVLSGNQTTIRIEGDPETMMIQYNDGTAEDPVWITAPDSERRNTPVYVMEKDGVSGAVYVVSTTSEPPELRYKEQTTLGDRTSAWYREAKQLLPGIMDGLGSDRSVPFLSLAPLTVSTLGGGH